jgi:hypothetical protein
MDKENENSDRCALSINSIACLNVSRRDLVRLRDRINNLDSSLKNLENFLIRLKNVYFYVLDWAKLFHATPFLEGHISILLIT